jgi:hypothetical protein
MPADAAAALEQYIRGFSAVPVDSQDDITGATPLHSSECPWHYQAAFG